MDDNPYEPPRTLEPTDKESEEKCTTNPEWQMMHLIASTSILLMSIVQQNDVCIGGSWIWMLSVGGYYGRRTTSYLDRHDTKR